MNNFVIHNVDIVFGNTLIDIITIILIIITGLAITFTLIALITTITSSS